MKKSISILLIAGLISFGFSPGANADDALQTVRESFRLAADNLDRQYREIKQCPEEKTWLPQMGLRGLYCHVKQYLNYEWLQGMATGKIFNKGPHTLSRLNLKSKGEFGYYNPAFIEGLREEILMHFTSDAEFAAKTQPQYDRHLKDMVRSYYRAYAFLQSGNTWAVNPSAVGYKGAFPESVDLEAVKTDYLRHLEANSLPDTYLQEIFRQPTDQLAGNGIEWYNVNTALGWWVRRSIDGTDKEFLQVVELFIKTYDANF